MSASWLKRVSLIQPTKMRLWTLLLLLWATQLLPDPAHPPLVPEGESVAKPEQVIADIDRGSPVNAIAFSPKGQLLASGSEDNSVRLWDPATGRHLRTLDGHGGSVSSLAFSPDGRLLASGSEDNSVRLWDPAAGKLLRTLEGHVGSVLSVAFGPDGRLLASGSSDRTVRLWDPATGKHLHTLESHGGSVSSLAFSRNGGLLASGLVDSSVHLWDAASGELLSILQGHANSVWSVAFSSDGQLLASGSEDNSVRLWDPAAGKLLRTLEGHGGSVSSLAFSPDGRLLASGSEDRTLRLWDLATGLDGSKLLRTLQGHGGRVRGLAFSPDGRLLASGSEDRTLRLWDPATGKLLRTLGGGHGVSVLSLSFSPDARLLASGSVDGTMRLWKPSSGPNGSKLLRTLKGHRDRVRSLAFSPNGKLLASGSEDNSVRLWDPTTGNHLRTLEGHRGSVSSVAFSPDGRLLASGSYDRSLRLWDLATGEHVNTLLGHGGSVSSVAFSPDGRLLASGSEDRTLRLWDPATGELLRTLEGHAKSVWSVAFSSDGRLLASGSEDRTLRLWYPEAAAIRAILFGSRDGLWAACRIPERRCLRWDDGTLLTWKRHNGLVESISLPVGTRPARLDIEFGHQGQPSTGPAPTPGDGQSAPVAIRIRNPGPENAYWVRLVQERAPGDPLLFTPPPVRILLGPGETWEPTAAVSYLAAKSHPQGLDGRLNLWLAQAHGDPLTLEIPVHGRAPELTLTGEPTRIEGDVPALAVRVHNRGEQELQEAEFRARVSGIDKPLARVSEDLVPAGTELALSFALPEDLELDADSRLTLEARELSFPRHDWTFEDLVIRLPAPPWQLYAWLTLLVLTLSVLLWYLRQYTHPLMRRLAAEPAALPELGLAELGKAKALLARTRRLGTVLSANGIHVRWLDRALRFREDAPAQRVKWLAQRLGARWQRLEGLGTDGAIERFELTLGEDFPLNLKTCSLVFPPGDWPEQDVLTSLGSGGDQVCLILSGNPNQQAALSRRSWSPENWLVAPGEGELSALLLSPEPVDAFARLIAGYLKVARISPYQTSAGVSKESAFFGRTQIISEIQHRVPANYLLVGGRQLGKSSLLLALKRRYDLEDGVDCSYLSVGKATVEGRLARALEMPSGSSLEAVLERLGELETGRRRLLLLDEADFFVQRDAERGYACLNGFRCLSDEGRCQFVLGGFWSLYRSAIFDFQAPIKNFAETISIGALEPEACRDLVIKPMAALNLRYASEGMVERILDLTGGRANLIAIVCDQMLKGLDLAQRELTKADLERALESRSLRSALEGWTNLTGDQDANRLDRLIVYGLIGRDEFGLGDLLELLTGLRFEAAPEQVKESLTRLELAFIVGRSQNRFRWQVPLWRQQVLAEEPQSMLERELETHRVGKG